MFGCQKFGTATHLLFQGTMGWPIWNGGLSQNIWGVRSQGLCALLTGSTLAQERLMPAGRHFLAGNSSLPLPPPPPPPLEPQAWPWAGLSPCFKSHARIGMPLGHLRSSHPSFLLRTQGYLVLRKVRGDKTSSLRSPGTPLGEAPQLDPFHIIWLSLSLVLGYHHLNGLLDHPMRQGAMLYKQCPGASEARHPQQPSMWLTEGETEAQQG